MEEKSQQTGKVIRRTKGFYYLRSETGNEVECKIKGRLFKNSKFNNQIAVGDDVNYIKNERDDVGLIVSINLRKSFLSRNRIGINAEQVIAANIDYLLIVASAKHPLFRDNLVNRMLVAAAVGNITPVIIITKTDLVSQRELDQIIEPYLELDLEIIQTSIKHSQQNPQLIEILTNGISVVAGQSGVGKSSLLNHLFPSLNIKVGAISQKTLKGSHTTTYAIMHQISNNGFVIDTPGIREFGLWNITQDNINQYYPKISEYQFSCKHRDCRHIHEPVCAVKMAVKNKEIHPRLYQGYQSIFNSFNENY